MNLNKSIGIGLLFLGIGIGLLSLPSLSVERLFDDDRVHCIILENPNAVKTPEQIATTGQVLEDAVEAVGGDYQVIYTTDDNIPSYYQEAYTRLNEFKKPSWLVASPNYFIEGPLPNLDDALEAIGKAE